MLVLGVKAVDDNVVIVLPFGMDILVIVEGQCDMGNGFAAKENQVALLHLWPDNGVAQEIMLLIGIGILVLIYFVALWAKLEALLIREGRRELAEACFAFLPARARLDILGYEQPDIFAH